VTLPTMEDIGFIFDWDGVIIDSHDQHEKSWHLLAEEMNTSVPEGFFKRTFGMRNQQIIPLWFTDLVDRPEEVAKLGDRKEALYREILRRDGIEPLAGVREFLQLMKLAGIRASVGSSTPRKNIETVIEMAGLDGIFDAIVSAEDVKRGKPEPEVFLLGAQRIERQPARCVVFEDAFVGIEAGLSAGMQVVAIASTNPLEALHRAHVAVPDLRGITPQQLVSRLGLC
jgi:beta-phosphoglucomutase family hydrolase